MKNYRYIIFDIDDTLFDFARSHHCVIRELFAREGQIAHNHTIEELWALAWKCWMHHGLHRSTDPYVLANYHRLYDDYLREYCEGIQRTGYLAAAADQLCQDIPAILSCQREPFDDVVPVLEALRGRAKLALASNGIDAVQLSRIQNLRHYFDDAFISEGMGCVKPDPAFWDIVFSRIDAQPGECLMVGDSLSSDIAGAVAYGMDTCWLNRGGRENTSGIQPTFTIRTLTELLENP